MRLKSTKITIIPFLSRCFSRYSIRRWKTGRNNLKQSNGKQSHFSTAAFLLRISARAVIFTNPLIILIIAKNLNPGVILRRSRRIPSLSRVKNLNKIPFVLIRAYKCRINGLNNFSMFSKHTILLLTKIHPLMLNFP
ncbi:MAG: hypothetical protein BWY26_01302 [Elusimicrobia bacterium ADurb.Bin231]|nr:MAG: hypothetical protein BWY26_01302 [Elusimicrobia bacterium ADurb.Bin231]